MAQSVGAVALDIVMGKNTVSGVAKQAIQEVQKTFNDASAGIGQKVSSVGQACSTMGAAMLPASTAVAGLGTSIVKTAANFDSAMSEVQAISGATGEDFEALRDKAQEMGAKTKFSASQSAEAMTYMAMAGWKTEDMLNGIEGIMNLAAASGEDLATTSDIVTDALTAFGKSAKDSGELADIMAAASSNANTNVYMMGETFKYAAPVAGALGYTMQDTALAIGLMANAGIKGSQAGTSLRSMFSRLASPPKECAKAMETLGISITNADGTMKPFREVIGDLREKFNGLSEAEQAQYAKAIAGQEAMSGLLAIVNAAPSDVDKLTSAIDNSSGSAQKMADTMNNNLNGQIILLKSQIEGLAIQLGEYLVPIVSQVVSAISKLATWFGNLDEGTKKTIVTIGLVVAVAAPVLLIVGKIISVIGGAVTAVGVISGAVSGFIGFIGATVMPALSGFFAFLLANPIVLVITAIVAAGALLIANWDKVKEVAGNLKEGVVNAWNNVKEKTSEAWENVKQKTSEAWENVKQKTSEAWNNVKQKTSETWNNVKTTVSEKANNIKTTVSEKWNNLKTNTSTAWNNIKTNSSTAWNNVKTTITNAVNNAKTSAINAFSNMNSGISGKVSMIKSTIRSGFDNAVSYIKGLASQAFSWGSDMIDGIVDGIRSCIGKVSSAVSNVASTIKSYLHFSVPDVGPLTDYETWMPDFIDGMAKGIDNNKYKLVDAVHGMASDMRIGVPALSAPALKNVGTYNQQVQTNTESNGNLIGLLTQLVESMQGNSGDITIPIYLGNDLIDERIVRANDRRTLRSGGRA